MSIQRVCIAGTCGTWTASQWTRRSRHTPRSTPTVGWTTRLARDALAVAAAAKWPNVSEAFCRNLLLLSPASPMEFPSGINDCNRACCFHACCCFTIMANQRKTHSRKPKDRQELSLHSSRWKAFGVRSVRQQQTHKRLRVMLVMGIHFWHWETRIRASKLLQVLRCNIWRLNVTILILHSPCAHLHFTPVHFTPVLTVLTIPLSAQIWRVTRFYGGRAPEIFVLQNEGLP
jgi:hypothetical protein